MWLQVYYMHLCCAHMLPWYVCERSPQHQAPAASHTGASHKGHNPYNSIIGVCYEYGVGVWYGQERLYTLDPASSRHLSWADSV